MVMTVSKSKLQTTHLVCVAVVLVTAAAAAQPAAPPAQLPAEAISARQRSVEAARPHARHVWRDTVPQNDDGTVNAYIEIPRGDRRKYELSIAANERFVDREMPRELGGYPINYGIVPQTISYDGDPFDALVLGPALRGGSLVRGVIVGVMHMDDEKGLDSKVILSRVDHRGRALHALRDSDRRRLADFFNRYKKHEPDKFSKVTGWGDAAAGLAFVRTTHGFFRAAAR
jgi:inorganic pyrophosphatase